MSRLCFGSHTKSELFHHPETQNSNRRDHRRPPNVPESRLGLKTQKQIPNPSNNTQFQTEEGEVKVMWLPPPPMWRTCEWWPPERCPHTCRGWGRSRRDCAQAQAPATAQAPSHAASGCWHWSTAIRQRQWWGRWPPPPQWARGCPRTAGHA